MMLTISMIETDCVEPGGRNLGDNISRVLEEVPKL
jgi:hypothetical protein